MNLARLISLQNRTHLRLIFTLLDVHSSSDVYLFTFRDYQILHRRGFVSVGSEYRYPQQGDSVRAALLLARNAIEAPTLIR